MSLFNKFKIGLGKSSSGLTDGFKNIFSKKNIDDEVLTKFEELIISSDAGVEVAKELRKDFEKRRVKKRYLAMIHGHPSREEWICQAPLKKNPDSPEKPAETFFRVLEKQAQQLALIEAFPNSGRFHQIRRHLLGSGHPIVGDFRYRESDLCKEFGERMGIGTRMLLQAKSLEFCHPITQVRLVIEAPIDPCIKHLAKI